MLGYFVDLDCFFAFLKSFRLFSLIRVSCFWKGTLLYADALSFFLWQHHGLYVLYNHGFFGLVRCCTLVTPFVPVVRSGVSLFELGSFLRSPFSFMMSSFATVMTVSVTFGYLCVPLFIVVTLAWFSLMVTAHLIKLLWSRWLRDELQVLKSSSGEGFDFLHACLSFARC